MPVSETGDRPASEWYDEALHTLVKYRECWQWGVELARTEKWEEKLCELLDEARNRMAYHDVERG